MNEELYKAVENNNIAKAEQLLRKGGDVNYLCNYTLLTRAVSLSNLAMCQLLIEHGADVDKKDSSDYPIHEAAKITNVDILKMLINKGADINTKKHNGSTALHIAVKESRLETVKILLSQTNLNLEITNNDGKTALQLTEDKTIISLIDLKKESDSETVIFDFSDDDLLNAALVIKKYKNDYEKFKSECDEHLKNWQDHLEKFHTLKLKNMKQSITKKEKEISTLDEKIEELKLMKSKAENEHSQLAKAIEKFENSSKAKEEDTKMSFTYNKRSFECCVCLTVPYTPKKVLSCTNGHCVCDRCKQTLQVCPICRVDISNVVRNLVVERLLAESQPVAESRSV